MIQSFLWFQKADMGGGLPELVQYGVVGICFLLIIAGYKLMTDFRKSYDKQTEAMMGLTVSLEGLKTMIQFQNRRVD